MTYYQIEKYQEIAKIEKEELKRNIESQFRRDFLDRETELRASLIKERDLEIEMVVRKLESETYSNSSDIHQKHRLEIERLNREHSDELKTVCFIFKYS